MPKIQLTQAKLNIGSLGSVSVEEKGRIYLDIEPDEVKGIIDFGDYRVLSLLLKSNIGNEFSVSTGIFVQYSVIEDYDYLFSVLGIKGVIGT